MSKNTEKKFYLDAHLRNLHTTYIHDGVVVGEKVMPQYKDRWGNWCRFPNEDYMHKTSYNVEELIKYGYLNETQLTERGKEMLQDIRDKAEEEEGKDVEDEDED